MSKRIGLIGAGYIADWHAEALKATPGVEIAAICDRSASAAEALAARYGGRVFTSVEDMLAAGACDAVHILTPPDAHKPIALHCLAAGLDVLVEKPVALSAADTRAIEDAAQAHGRRFWAGHNFLGLPSYERLKRQVADGTLGRVSEAQISWALPLAPLRSGPYGLWLMRDLRNLLLELGPHPFSFAVDLLGPLDVVSLVTGQEIALPGAETRPQSWRILARAGDVDVTITLSMVETVDDRSVTLRGSSGMARLDYAADTLVTNRDNTADLVLNPLRKQLGQAGAHLREGLRNAGAQVASLNRKSPYGQSFRGMTRAIHGTGEDTRFSGATALRIMEAIDASLTLLPARPAPAIVTGTPSPDVMVIGGTGYIGRTLTRALVAKGHDVRVVSRGRHGPFPDIADHVETVPVALEDTAALVAAMQGIGTVYNLAKSMDTTWEAALKNDVGTAVRIGEAALEAGVRRLIYTGTIASYDMSDPKAVITEATGFGDIAARNLYARSKAECERQLMEMHRTRGLPLVIARPGIVVGGDGPLQHWGIGRWHGAGAVKLWGNGRNILPFVLVDDLSEALIAMMETEAAVGQSFNLTGEPMLTGRDYFDAIHQRFGARLRVTSGSLTAMWLAGGVKYGLKRYALGRKDAVCPSLADWRSRAHLARFDNSLAKSVLDWRPEADRQAFVARALDAKALFGL
ncbi:NAD-dependent epimerase/dehydratase family protein [Nioella nitratireducens]|uniref:NAD-dependent epimerase/dehydratase family protein n=1 Tax=Nioella nitratireducens TaxID=1287720 RepID=UPI0008FD226E|nr:NAD-dependent epimerase/dehydratase family protein [Nioella nitratireducens]